MNVLPFLSKKLEESSVGSSPFPLCQLREQQVDVCGPQLPLESNFPECVAKGFRFKVGVQGSRSAGRKRCCQRCPKAGFRKGLGSWQLFSHLCRLGGRPWKLALASRWRPDGRPYIVCNLPAPNSPQHACPMAVRIVLFLQMQDGVVKPPPKIAMRENTETARHCFVLSCQPALDCESYVACTALIALVNCAVRVVPTHLF